MLWVDKYRPKHFDKFLINQDKAASLQKLVDKGVPHAQCVFFSEPHYCRLHVGPHQLDCVMSPATSLEPLQVTSLTCSSMGRQGQARRR